MIPAYRVCGPWGTPLDIAERFYIAAAALGFLLIAAMPCSDELGQAASNLVRISCVTDTRPSARLGSCQKWGRPTALRNEIRAGPCQPLEIVPAPSDSGCGRQL